VQDRYGVSWQLVGGHSSAAMRARYPRAMPLQIPTAELARVRLLALDVDGTLTTGAVTYIDDGRELVAFDVRDGQGLVWLRMAGVAVVWITGRGCAATRRRAEELGVVKLLERAGPKAAVLAKVQEELGIGPDATASMGDDLPDLGLFERSAVRAAPSDARPEVLAAANFVAATGGGRGAVRELCEAILKAQGRWESGPRAAHP
jgi:3-deoxy-D-manno-octulosonate 8-phosphate phosphatase (KDO 8-P phosphatase)